MLASMLGCGGWDGVGGGGRGVLEECVGEQLHTVRGTRFHRLQFKAEGQEALTITTVPPSRLGGPTMCICVWLCDTEGLLYLLYLIIAHLY